MSPWRPFLYKRPSVFIYHMLVCLNVALHIFWPVHTVFQIFRYTFSSKILLCFLFGVRREQWCFEKAMAGMLQSGYLALRIAVTWQGCNFIRLSISFIGPYNNCSWSLIPSSQFYGSWGKHVFLSSVIMCTLYIIKKGFYFNFTIKWSVLKLQLRCFMDSAKFNDFPSWLDQSFHLGSPVRNLWEGWYFTCKFSYTHQGFSL